MLTDDPPTYRFTAKIEMHHNSSTGIMMAYVIETQGLRVTRGRSVRLVPWTAFRFLHLHVTSGVGTTGFPVYSTRLRTLFASRELSSLDWQGDSGLDRSADYVRFMEELIPFAVACNPRLRLRCGGDPMMETAIPTVMTLLIVPFVFFALLVFKPLGALLAVWTKPFGKVVAGAISVSFGVVLNMLPWSTGKPFNADDLPTAELPSRYRKSGV